MVYYAYIYPFLTYSLTVWGNVVKFSINRIVSLQKQAIRLVYGIKRLDHVAHIAYKNSILLLPELYVMSLSCFFRYYIMHCNASLLVSGTVVNRLVTKAVASSRR